MIRRGRSPIAWLSLLIVFLCTARVASADGRGIEAFVADVLARNPSIGAQALRRDAFRYEASAASVWPDPSVAVMLDNVPERMGGDMPMVRYQLSQMVPWPGKLGLMRDTIERRGDAAEATLAVRRLDLVLDAKRAYLMLALNERTREINVASQSLIGTIVSAAIGRYSAGLGGHHEVARAQVELNALGVEQLNLEGERVSVVAMLNSLRNLPPGTPIPDPKDVTTPAVTYSAAVLAERGVRERPEIAAMQAMKREEQTMAALARRERYPDLMTSVWYNQVLTGPDSGGVMLGVTLPVFGVTRQSRLASAYEARASGAQQDIAAMQAMIRFQVADAARKVDTANRELEFLTTIAVPRVQQSFDSTLAAYSTGTTDVTGLLDARRSLQTTELTVARAQITRELAIAELERAIGGSLRGPLRKGTP